MKSLVLIILIIVGVNVNVQPSAEITNGIVSAKILLPDSANGYYRGTRFDWSGVIEKLEVKGHNFHGKWFRRYDPYNHDAIMGPVEEFGPLDFREGEPFIKIGIGRLIDSSHAKTAYNSFKKYQLIDAGVWKVKKGRNFIEFSHDLKNTYRYVKRLELVKGSAKLIISHQLKNMRAQPIITDVYNHNFFVIDSAALGPAYELIFPIDSLNLANGRGLGEVISSNGNQLVYLRDLRNGEQAYFPDLAGGKEIPYAISVTNKRSGAGVKISSERAINKLVFWSSSTTVCPEPYININVLPSASFSWKITYDYSIK